MARRTCGCHVVRKGFLAQLFGSEPYDVRCWDYSVGPDYTWYPYRDGFKRLSTARKVARRTSTRECGPSPPAKEWGWEKGWDW